MNKRKLRIGLVLAPLALAFFAFTQPALAADYTGDCANVPASVSGNVDINESGACNITHPVTATGRIKITAGSTISTQDLNSFAEVDLQAPASSNITVTGAITTDSGFVNLFGNNIIVTGTINPVNLGNILIRAQSNLVTGQIIGAPGSNIDLKANQAGASNTLFTIGGSGNTNGVNGTITAKPAGYDPYFAPAIVHVVNGTANSTGGITLTSPANIITTPQPGSRAAYVFLNARNGTLTIPTGTLSANGGTSDGAGLIALMAKTIAFGANATVTASQSSTAAGTLHGILISAENVTYQGTSGLNLIGSGNGADISSTGYVQVFPKGVVTISDTETPFNLVIYAVIGTNQAGNVTFQGAGTAPLNVTADGNNTRIAFTGTTLTFTGGAVKMQTRGATNHTIRLVNPGELTGANVGLTFSGTGAVTLDALGVAGAGGDIELFLDKANFNKPTYTFTANGPTASSGNGGTVNVSSQLLTLSPTTKFTSAANASIFGTGDAIASDPTTGAPKAIRFYPGDVPLNLGTASGLGQISFSAKGGLSGGKGGTIVVSGNSLNIKTANAVNASAVGGDGAGGEIAFQTPIASFESVATMSAIGKGNGVGGKFSGSYYGFPVPINVNKLIKVAGGSALPATEFNGSITVNNITCQQWKTGKTSFPKTAWHCLNQASPNAGQRSIETSAFSLPSVIRTDLNAQNVQIYTMNTVSDFKAFFYGIGSSQSGVLGLSINSVRVSASFDSQIGGSAGGLSFYHPGTILHELGHVWDSIKGDPSINNALTFKSVVDSDVAAFNALPCADAITATTGNATFCTLYAGQTNFWIFQKLLNFPQPGTTDYIEAWARAFAHRGQSSIPNPNKNFLPFIQNVQELMTGQRGYMNSIYSTGSPF